MFRCACVTGVFGLLIAGLPAGCTLDPANCPTCQARLGGGQTAPSFARGELGGACLIDGTCEQGLECLDDVCLPDSAADTMLVFHNNSGPMCMAALRWMEEAQAEFSSLVIEEHLTTDADEADLLDQLVDQFVASEGVSTSFEYLPIFFFKGRAFSGFDAEVEAAMEALLQPEDEETP
ncbi:MAG: hypothetical protein JXB13_08290 [Phycisphaerae bacterium]|nr:hypothetical protein [Phycisphaerae bacterium]